MKRAELWVGLSRFTSQGLLVENDRGGQIMISHLRQGERVAVTGLYYRTLLHTGKVLSYAELLHGFARITQSKPRFK